MGIAAKEFIDAASLIYRHMIFWTPVWFLW